MKQLLTKQLTYETASVRNMKREKDIARELSYWAGPLARRGVRGNCVLPRRGKRQVWFAP
jgi:hypothetical protein